jgi:hypothetical protein
MFSSPLVITLLGYSLLCFIGLASCLIGASLYDLKEAKIDNQIRKHPYTKKNRFRPLISIVVYISNNNQNVQACLESIRKSNYHHYEIIVVDDTNTINRNIKTIVTKFSTRYPKITIHLLQRRKKTTQISAIAAGIKKWGHGQLVINLAADALLDKQALRNSSRHFISNKLAVLVPNIQVAPSPSLIGLFQQFDQLVRSSAKKLISISGLKHMSTSFNIIYRRSSKVNLNSLQNTKYAHNVLVITAPKETCLGFLRSYYLAKLQAFSSLTVPGINFNKPSSLRKIVLGFYAILFQMVVILTPFVISYLFYLAAYFKQSALYGLSWTIFSLVLLSMVWSKNHITLFRKLRLTVLVPLMYIPFYIMSIFHLLVMYVVAVKSVLKKPKIA